MANLTVTFNGLLKGHEAPPTRALDLDTADEFLKEAYRIVSMPVCFVLAWDQSFLRMRPLLTLPYPSVRI